MEGSASGKGRLVPADKVKYQLNANLVVTEVNKASWLQVTSRRWRALVFTFEDGEAGMGREDQEDTVGRRYRVSRDPEGSWCGVLMS